MPLKRNYHMHTELCGHAKGSILDNILMAEHLGYEEIGFSEHAPLPLEAFNEADNKRLYAYENILFKNLDDVYLNPLKKYIDEHKSKINIRIGLESEYISGYYDFYKSLRDKVEYMILGVHFFKSNGKLIDTYSEIDSKTIYDYAECVEEALGTGLFKILAHPDLYLYNDIPFDDDAKRVADRIIEACIKNNVLVEINCNGKGKYPRPEFYEYIKNKNAKFIIGVDSHDPKRLEGYHIEDSINLGKRLGLNIISEV